MNARKVWPILCFALSSTLFSCGQGPEASSSSSSSVPSSTTQAETVSLSDKIEGGAIETMNRSARAYLEAENPVSALLGAKAVSGDGTEGVKLRWKFENANPKSSTCTLEIALDEEFEKIVKTVKNIRKSVGSCTVYNLVPGVTYYYRVRSEKAVSEVDSFTLKGNVRTIETGDTVRNMRDLGGWKTGEGRFVKYGLLYRSADWSKADSTTDAFFKDLGIKTELDVRYGETTSKHPVSDIDFYNYGLYQYDAIVPGTKKYNPTESTIKSIFELLSKKSSYPLVFHCTSGADRTGTLAYLVNGLLGVSYEDLCKDFELTSFYLDARYRSKIVDGAFDESGIMQDDSNNYVAFGALHNAITSQYGEQGGSLSEAIANFLKIACNISEATLNSIKSILTEEK